MFEKIKLYRFIFRVQSYFLQKILYTNEVFSFIF